VNSADVAVPNGEGKEPSIALPWQSVVLNQISEKRTVQELRLLQPQQKAAKNIVDTEPHCNTDGQFANVIERLVEIGREDKSAET
jgi:hypothetical protein